MTMESPEQRAHLPGPPPAVVETAAQFDQACAAVAAGSGPIAVDTERASGYRYGQRAFLVQLWREGAGTVLIDPVEQPDLSAMALAMGDAEWVLHAASQDLPCLAEVGLVPPGPLFDTELGGRLAGLPRVGLGPMVAHYLDIELAKEHSAVDWSTRPLPEPWLQYAALDVELLVQLRDLVAQDLNEQGKLAWAEEEFEWVKNYPTPEPRKDPWRRTSGIHSVRQRRHLAMVRELWKTRDELAQQRDVSPGRILPDRAVIALVQANPTSVAEMSKLPHFSGSGSKKWLPQWSAALDRARNLPDADLPEHAVRSDGPPPPRVWRDRDPLAADRLASAKAAIATLGEQWRIPVENLLTPSLVRSVCWAPPEVLNHDSIRQFLVAANARTWQIDLVLDPLLEALVNPTPFADGADTPAEPDTTTTAASA